MSYVIWPDGPVGDALQQVNQECWRQEELKRSGRFPHTCADKELALSKKLAILAEEFGEVARAVLEAEGLANDKHNKALRKELIQVAAVCVKWASGLDE